jgi:hypothetical protein
LSDDKVSCLGGKISATDDLRFHSGACNMVISEQGLGSHRKQPSDH